MIFVRIGGPSILYTINVGKGISLKVAENNILINSLFDFFSTKMGRDRRDDSDDSESDTEDEKVRLWTIFSSSLFYIIFLFIFKSSLSFVRIEASKE